ncbi:TolC family protein [candidate division KSB1 bacterium]|nr:TolC family protein [candidate division KSB1 bacterium]
MSIRTILRSLIIIIIIASPSMAQDMEKSLNLDQMINEALKNNPEYISFQHQWHATEAQIPQAGALPDPTLGFALANLPVNSFAFDQEPMTGKKISLMQMFPFPGKLGTKQDIADYQAQVVGKQVEEAGNMLIKNVKSAYFTIFILDKSIEIVERNKGLMQQFVQVAETKYSVGKGLQQDVLKAQVEVSKLTDKLISLQQKRTSVALRLNTLLNRDINSPVPKLADFEPTPFQLSIEAVQDLGTNHRPLLTSWQFMVEKSKSATKLARMNYLPDISVGVAYTQRNDLSSGMKMYDFFSTEVNVSVPLYFFKKQSKQIEETQLTANSIEDRYQQVKNEIQFQIEDAFNELHKNATLIDLYKTGIILQATQALKSAQSGYQVDKVDFLTLLNNQVTLFNYETEYYRVLTDYEKALAELEAAVGVRF